MASDTYQNQDPNHPSGVSDNIFAQIRKEQQDYMFNWISIVPGFPFNTYYTIKRIHLYTNSKYMSDGGVYTNPSTMPATGQDNTYNGHDKLFFNVVIPPCEVATRMLNIDTKNIRLWPQDPQSQFSTYLLEKELKQWLKGNKFSLVLNKLAEEAPRYGTVVLEKTADGAEVVDLRRFFLDPTVESVQDSRFVTTVTYMTPTQMRDAGLWDQAAVEQAINRYENFNTSETYEDQYVNINLVRSTPYIKVFKRYGEVPAHWLDKTLAPGTFEGEKMVRSVFIVAGADWLMKNNDGKAISDMGVVLYKSKWIKPWPFKDFHYMKTRGRWLGIGVVEMLFDVQERINEIKNQKRVAMEISAMHLFQTADKSITRNILTDLQSGDILLTGKDGINPIVNEERNLPAFKDEEQSYLNQANNLSFAYEALRGDVGDSSTPLGTTQIAVAQGTSVFAFKKENLALFVQEFFNDLVLPQLLKDLTPDHIMRFTGSAQELQAIDEAAATVFANEHIKQRLLGYKVGQPVPSQHEHTIAKQAALNHYRKLGGDRFLQIKKGLYNDVNFEFDFLVTDEQADPAKMATNIQAVITEVSQNPNILTDPRLKLLFNKLCEQLGISTAEIEIADHQAQQNQAAEQAQQPQAAQLPGPSGVSVGRGFSQKPAAQ